MKIWKIASGLPNEWSAWILGSGEIIKISHQNHAEFVLEHPEKFNITKSQLKQLLNQNSNRSI